MAQALDKLLPFDFIIESDRALPADEQTVFRLRPLTAIEYQRAGEHSAVSTAECWRYVLKSALLGWSNFRDSAGEVKFLSEITANLSRLSHEQTGEIANKILESSQVTENDRKN